MKTPVGVVGTGYLGRLHARVLTEIPEAQVVGFVDPNDAVAAEVESSLKLRRFPDVASLAKEIRCAVVATPTVTHYEVASELISAGCDVMVEKPITHDEATAQKLIDLAAAADRIIQVGHVERYNPAIAAVAELVRGTRYFEAERLGVFVARSLDVDVLLDLMIHDLNLVCSLMGDDVEEIRAVGVPVMTGKVDIANVRLQLTSGAVANLTASRVSQERVRKQRFFGSDFYYSIDTKEQEVKGYRLNGNTVEPAIVEVRKQEPLRAELESFLQCVRERSKPVVTGEDGLAAVKLAIRVAGAIEESMRRFES